MTASGFAGIIDTAISKTKGLSKQKFRYDWNLLKLGENKLMKIIIKTKTKTTNIKKEKKKNKLKKIIE